MTTRNCCLPTDRPAKHSKWSRAGCNTRYPTIICISCRPNAMPRSAGDYCSIGRWQKRTTAWATCAAPSSSCRWRRKVATAISISNRASTRGCANCASRTKRRAAKIANRRFHQALYRSLPSACEGRPQQRVQQPDRPACRDDGNDANFEPEQRNQCGQAKNGGEPFESAVEAFRPQHVVRKKNGQIQDDADDRCGDPRQRRRKFQIAMRGFNQRCPEKDKNETRQEREVGNHHRGDCRASQQVMRTEDLLDPTTD